MKFPAQTAQSVAICVALGIALTACGGTKDASDTDGETSATAAVTKRDVDLTQDTFVSRVFGAISKAGSAKVSFESDNTEEQPRGDGEVKYGDELAMRINLMPYGSPDDTSDVILVGETMYQKGISEGNRPNDGKYSAMSVHVLESMGMPDIPGLLDPRSKAKAFSTAVTSFKQTGAPETLDGVEATPYAFTIDPSKAAKAHQSWPSDVVHLTFYVGADDLPRKLVFKAPYSTFTATYSDWGTPVDIKPPPDAEVRRLP
jgi:lipoprotein LprG